MNINDIRLPAQLVAELYRTTLVDTGENPAKTEASQPKNEISTEPEFPSVGKNLKNILIIVPVAGSKIISAKELKFLSAMLSACNLSTDDVAIINQKEGSDWKQMMSVFKPRNVFLFDIEPSQLGLPINFPHYQLQAYSNATFLYAPSLSELENDKLQKSKLWVSLKRLFNL
jgi:hypothetical protein